MKIKRNVKDQYALIYISLMTIFTNGVNAQTVTEPYQLPYTQAYLPIPNMLFDLSVEFPTGNTPAYKSKNFDSSYSYHGYFEPDFCYQYNNAGQYFYPVSRMVSGTCAGKWSGRFLNWASMGVLDSFRSVLTGGNRVVDSQNITRLQRSWFDGRGSLRFSDTPEGPEYTLFPDKNVPSSIVANHTELAAGKDYIIANLDPFRYGQIGRSLSPDVTVGDYFRVISSSAPINYIYCAPEGGVCNVSGTELVSYGAGDKAVSKLATGSIACNNSTFGDPNVGVVKSCSIVRTTGDRYYHVVVEVCSNPLLLESFCKKYPSGFYKPIGLFQRYANKSRFGIFSYPNIDWVSSGTAWDPDNSRQAGGVMRTPLKNLGSQSFNGASWVGNANPEWSDATGQFLVNPDGNTNAGAGSRSGVVNYINKFGYLANANGWHYKAADPAAELYYESLRYFASNYSGGGTFGILPLYQSRGGVNNSVLAMTEGFPMILNGWRDPLVNKCSKNAIVFLGDVNTNCDARVPGGVDIDGNYEAKCDDRTRSSLNPPLGRSLATGITSQVDVTQMLNDMHGYENVNFMPFSSGNSDWQKIACPESEGVGRGCWVSTSLNLAGLAYWAHSRDIRPDLEGDQTVSTYIVDVHELPKRSQLGSGDFVAGKDPTQYWYAAKYGAYDLDVAKQQNIADPNSKGKIIDTGSVVPSWDLNEDGIPDGWFEGSNPENIRKSFSDIFLKVTSNSSQVTANVEVASDEWSNNNKIFMPFYYVRNGVWSGDVLAMLGGVGANQSLRNADGTLSVPPVWSANQQLDNFFDDTRNAQGKITLAGAEKTANSRAVISGSSVGSGVHAFRWGSLTAQDRIFLNDKDNLGSLRVDYIRGDYRNEIRFGGAFRDRIQGRMGGVINSSPLYVGAPDEGYSDSDFSSGAPSFKSFSTAKRTGVVYVGADDGMLHAFDAQVGNELFSYIPGMVINKLPELTRGPSDYDHKLFVDGNITASSLIVNGAWKTALMGTLGAGGRGFYVLDVTDPNVFRLAESQPNSIVKLEVSQNTPLIGSQVGYMLNNPGHNSRNNASYAIGRVRWAPGQIKTALFIGNGYGTSAVSLVIVNLEDVMSRATGASSAWDPSLVKVVSVPSLGGMAWDPSSANGLASPTAVDTDFDGVVDTVYSGDFQGNIWKFDLSSPSGAWHLASSKSGIGLPLFRAKFSGGVSGQRITTAPLVVEGCTAVGRIVTFGTGSVLDEVALRSTTPNTIYGILDDAIYPTQPYTTVPFSKLLNHPFLTSGNYRYNNRVPVNYPATMGWFVDLSYASERVITSPMMYGGNVLFSTYIPTAFTDSCDAQEGQGALVSLDVCNGSSPENPFFDTNNDRVVDGGDHASWNAGLFASSKKYTGPVTLGRVLNKNIYSDPTARTGKQTICQLVNSRESTSVGCAPMIRKRASWREIRQKP